VDSELKHIPVLKEEVFEFINLPSHGTFIDCTLGLGGHTADILSRTGEGAHAIAFEVDEENLAEAEKRLSSFQNQVTFIRDNFITIHEYVDDLEDNCVQAILFDLGLSSPHVDKGARGFSFLRGGPLDMRFDQRSGRTAQDLIQRLSPRELIRIFKEYGEEPHARQIAENIVKVRKAQPFKTTIDLADFIEEIIPRRGKEHPATRVFQALRIAVNEELDVLAQALQNAVSVLCPGGRIVVISYHSLEDRIVKNTFKTFSRPQEGSPVLNILTKKPLVPTHEEIKANPRARSAKLRCAEKI
jgi:16S rRNA (cytosine1402-N4)-methyltransferase